MKLRPYLPGDAETILTWIPDETAFRQWSADRYDRYPITPEDVNRQYAAASAAGPFFPMTAVDERGIAGHLILRCPDPSGESIRFGFVIVDSARRGQGLGKELLRLALDHAFSVLKAREVTLGVFENNPAARFCYLAAGFREVRTGEPEFFHVLGEDWKCLEMVCEAPDRPGL